jgi:hypothetical protein
MKLIRWELEIHDDGAVTTRCGHGTKLVIQATLVAELVKNPWAVLVERTPLPGDECRYFVLHRAYSSMVRSPT